ncbi:hypothetical protein TOPH_00829 [Tolypocladium ophioglossoides CBS 100239]|uniref:2EXR domain-containing protein n=1 Tax=Tolypocladium ophioglossoides (strain CBS 100239) TaxID=1163406 RepID=A0A0L0NKF1_TOLOC|nr:hypothetical protein TOPH_00829 [Tolypocladium ophioglossoides CBS 100239]
MSAVTTPIKFKVPDGCGLFTMFPRLPPELRQQIWEAYLTNPGVNFVKLETLDPRWRWGMPTSRTPVPGSGGGSSGKGTELSSNVDDIDMVVKDEASIRRAWHARLVSESRNGRADISNYEELYRQLVTLARTCFESMRLIQSLVNRPGVLALSNENIVTLDKSPDLVYLDYFPPEFYDTNCNLDFKLDCPGLELIRRAAVRFSHNWHPRKVSNICRSCGKPHEGLEPGHYPAHLYQFLARYMPRLEDFYLIDYFIVPKTKEERGDPMCLDEEESVCENARPEPRPPQVFRAKNRLFHEIIDGGASDAEWKIDPKTRHVRAWLQDSFVRYAKASKISRHKDPERVRFGILACEWDISVSVTHKYPAPTTPKRPRAKPMPKGPALFGNLRPSKSPFENREHMKHSIISPRMFLLCDKALRLNAWKSTPMDVDGPIGTETRSHTTRGRGGAPAAVFGTGNLDFFTFTFRKLYGSVVRWSCP